MFSECRAHHHVNKHKHAEEFVPSSDTDEVKPASTDDHKEPTEGITYHGIIHEDAQEGDEVELDQPITAHNRHNLQGGL